VQPPWTGSRVDREVIPSRLGSEEERTDQDHRSWSPTLFNVSNVSFLHIDDLVLSYRKLNQGPQLASYRLHRPLPTFLIPMLGAACRLSEGTPPRLSF
jgi:hypothetical protein